MNPQTYEISLSPLPGADNLKYGQYQGQLAPLGVKAEFIAMASRCEILVRHKVAAVEEQAYSKANLEIERAIVEATDEVRRIEAKYSRFDRESLLSEINRRAGEWQTLDDETLGLLKFAEHCYQLSQGQFDITAEPVIALWPFGDRHASPPSKQVIQAARKRVGFNNLDIQDKRLWLPEEMGIDFGGLAKEYASDIAMAILTKALPDCDLLVNLGGDMITSPAPAHAWQIGIEDPKALDSAERVVALNEGALATSGHSRRYLIHEGKRYGHIIDPSTGYPVKGAPLSVSVFAPQCVVAGMLATLAMLQGEEAEAFLASQGVVHHIIRG
ncbi:FAD:protein FMN transferase [Shewanella marisflavi]|uniref:FAD:protein FMN transferase n=1 Tax=Shewanella marisflavi TaxID=260364 RepID=UPI00200BFB31|nr:FAD:protein FMN transferase [Shewanella marisflavi]MCL1041062.1 FAD:protein FMN transferase [Shewanella marisflavi]